MSYCMQSADWQEKVLRKHQLLVLFVNNTENIRAKSFD